MRNFDLFLHVPCPFHRIQALGDGARLGYVFSPLDTTEIKHIYYKISYLERMSYWTQFWVQVCSFLGQPTSRAESRRNKCPSIPAPIHIFFCLYRGQVVFLKRKYPKRKFSKKWRVALSQVFLLVAIHQKTNKCTDNARGSRDNKPGKGRGWVGTQGGIQEGISVGTWEGMSEGSGRE